MMAMDDRNITLISFGPFEKSVLEKVSGSVARAFAFPATLKEGHMDIGEFFDPARKQYDGDRLLRAVDALSDPASVKTVGIFRVDLYIPILTFIFGQAYLGGRTGIASLYRLKNEWYGIPGDEALLADRLGKEVIHELGHTFGLVHCHIPDCVMRSGTYVEDIDQKSSLFCHNCREILREESLKLRSEY